MINSEWDLGWRRDTHHFPTATLDTSKENCNFRLQVALERDTRNHRKKTPVSNMQNPHFQDYP